MNDLEKLADLYECENCLRYVPSKDLRFYPDSGGKSRYYCLSCVDMLIQIADVKKSMANYKPIQEPESRQSGFEPADDEEEGNLYSRINN